MCNFYYSCYTKQRSRLLSSLFNPHSCFQISSGMPLCTFPLIPSQSDNRRLLVVHHLRCSLDILGEELKHYNRSINNQLSMRELDAQQSDLKTKQRRTGKHRQFGNLIMFSNEYVHVSIGPHYKEFMMGYAMLLMYEFGLMWLVFTQIKSILCIQLGVFLCITAPILYLLTALSNPGVYQHEECREPKTKYCHRCQHFIPNSIVHCEHCDVCVKGYDHHCRWVSKCVGRNNIIPFFSFIISLGVLNAYLYYILYIVFWANNLSTPAP